MIAKARMSIPADCDYAVMIADLLAWYEQKPDDWRWTWKRIEYK